MGITNEQTVEAIKAIGEQVVQGVARFAEQVVIQQAEWLNKNEAEHADYRRSMAELAQAVVLLQAEHAHTREQVAENKKTNDQRWSKVWGIVAVVLVLVVTAIVTGVLK